VELAAAVTAYIAVGRFFVALNLWEDGVKRWYNCR
jgi:hypothetical protein